jgi:iron complex transport system substrate-binding protein
MEVAMPASRLLKPLIVPLLLAVLMSCGGAGAAGPSSTGSFPLTLTTAAGKVTIPHRPSRIVSLSATATEDLYAVGAGAQVVAVDDYSNYPANAPKTSLSGFKPNVEAIAGYRPDLVLVSDDTNGIVGQLGRLQIPTLVEPPAADLGGVYAQLGQIGQATGHPAQASTEIASLKQQVQSILRSVPATSRKLTVYHELDQTYFSATTHTFIGQVYRLLGLEDIADAAPASNPYPQLSSEFVISANPDLIVLADTVCCGQSLATVRARPGWSAINAVKNSAVVPVDDSIASEWGPRIAVFMQTIANELKTLRGPSA